MIVGGSPLSTLYMLHLKTPMVLQYGAKPVGEGRGPKKFVV